MNCFPCFSSQRSKKSNSKREPASPSKDINESASPDIKRQKPGGTDDEVEKGNNMPIQTYTFRELATATKNFRQECLLGEGGFGRVYKGTIQASGQVVAVKQLDRNGLQGNKEFVAEVSKLSLLHHSNLLNLIGYCADGDQRLLVFEYMPKGSVEDQLLDIKGEERALDWVTRIRIAYGAAQGLEYLHEKVNPPVIYGDLKSSSILLDEDMKPKLSDFGLDKPGDQKMPISSRVMGTYGYCAPEYARGSQLTVKSDVYSFGVVLLELITGRRVIDTTKPPDQQNLVSWAQPIFRDPKRFPDMSDPLLQKQFPERDLNQAVAIAAMCLQDEATARPLISDVVTALSFLSMESKPDQSCVDHLDHHDNHNVKSDDHQQQETTLTSTISENNPNSTSSTDDDDDEKSCKKNKTSASRKGITSFGRKSSKNSFFSLSQRSSSKSQSHDATTNSSDDDDQIVDSSRQKPADDDHHHDSASDSDTASSSYRNQETNNGSQKQNTVCLDDDDDQNSGSEDGSVYSS